MKGPRHLFELVCWLLLVLFDERRRSSKAASEDFSSEVSQPSVSNAGYAEKQRFGASLLRKRLRVLQNVGLNISKLALLFCLAQRGRGS